MKSRVLWIGIGFVLIVAAIVAIVVLPNMGGQNAGQQAEITTGTVTTTTDIQSVESSGTIEAQQAASLFWETTGTVGAVYVTTGDTVQKGDLLMALDPASAPQNVIQAQASLVTAQNALDDLMNPEPINIATAQQAVADAEQALKDAKQDLVYAQNPVGQPLYDAIDDAKLALENAQTNAQLQHVSADSTAIKNAEDDMNLAFTRLQRAQVEWDDCVKISCGERDQRERALNNAQKDYERAQNDYNAAKLKYDNGVANQTDTVESAQEDYDQAVRNLNAALLGPDPIKVAQAQSAVDVAEADLAQKQKELIYLVDEPDTDDLLAAQASVLSAQVTLDSAYIKAPFDGIILAVNFQPGDSVSQTESAIMLVNRNQLHVEVSVDESDISDITVNDPVNVTFDSLPDITLSGVVTEIAGFGVETQGLIRYTVRVDITEPDPRVLLGMTTNVNIVTEMTEGALAVPLNAIQLDSTGEYVNRVKPDGSFEQVRVVSSTSLENDMVVVTGALTPGDTLQVIDPQPSTDIGGPFGPG